MPNLRAQDDRVNFRPEPRSEIHVRAPVHLRLIYRDHHCGHELNIGQHVREELGSHVG